jgi:hypothetical protein
VSFAAIILYVASQRMFIVVSIYFLIDSVRKLLDTPSYVYHTLSHPYMLSPVGMFRQKLEVKHFQTHRHTLTAVRRTPFRINLATLTAVKRHQVIV